MRIDRAARTPRSARPARSGRKARFARVRRAARASLLVLVLGSFAFAAPAIGQEGAGAPPAARRSEQRPANIPFLFSAYALTWAAIWIYLLLIHSRQRRVERMLARLERSGEGSGRERG